MKVIILRDRDTDDETRIVRYGVRDFQLNENGTTTLFYGHDQREHAHAPDEETITGALVAAEDSYGFDEDNVYAMDDFYHELHEADDLRDYRLDPPEIEDGE